MAALIFNTLYYRNVFNLDLCILGRCIADLAYVQADDTGGTLLDRCISIPVFSWFGYLLWIARSYPLNRYEWFELLSLSWPGAGLKVICSVALYTILHFLGWSFYYRLDNIYQYCVKPVILTNLTEWIQVFVLNIVFQSYLNDVKLF